MTAFVRWLTHTHAMRWHAHYHTTGTGHLYQGRYKSFPVQTDGHFLAVCRYVERYGCMVTIDDNPPNFRGSGTLVQVGELTFVATARHLFENLDPSAKACFWWGLQAEHECIRIDDIRWLGADIDIAVARLHADCQVRGLPVDRIDLNPALDNSELWFASGISQAGVKIDHQCQQLAIQHWILGLCALPVDRWPHVDPPLAADSDLLAHYSNKYALDGRGEPMPPVDPRGISGGGIWAVRLTGDGVWSPAAAARLIGIQRSTEEKRWSWLRATQVTKWLELVRANWLGVAPILSAKLEGMN